MRHGLTVMNKAGLRAGSTETPLTDEGRAVARQAASNLKDLHIDTIVSSSMGRAVETAEIVADEIGFPISDIKQTNLLIERDFGVLEGAVYVADQDMDNIEGMESSHDLQARVEQAVTWIQTLPGENVLIVSHGATGRMLRHVLNPNIPFVGASHFKNAEIIKLS